MNQALGESEERYKTLFNVSSDAIFVHGMTKGKKGSTFIEVNDIACSRLGYTREELLRMTPEDIDAPESQGIPQDKQKELTRTGTIFFNQVHITKTGERIPVEIHTHRFAFRGKELFISMARDISLRRIAEEQLQLLSSAIEQSPVSVVITNPDGVIEYVNQKFCDVTGYASGEVIGENPRILKSGHQSDEFYRELWLTISAGDLWQGELCNRKKDGSVYWEFARIVPIRSDRGQILHYVGIKEDITNQRQAEQEYEFIKRTSLDGFWIVAKDGSFLEVNDAYCEMTSYTREALLTMRVSDVEARESKEETDKHIAKMIEYGYDRFESQHKKKNGEIIDVEVSARYLDLRGGIFIAFIHDITGRKIIQQYLDQELGLHQSLVKIYEPLISATRIEEVTEEILVQAKLLTQSEHGYVSTIDPVTKNMIVHTFTAMLRGHCNVEKAQRKIIFPIGKNGDYPNLWGLSLNTRTSFYTNHPSKHPASKGLPKGHIPLHSFLSVPVLYHDQLAGQIALANSARNYTDRDLVAIEWLAANYAIAIQRLNMEGKLKQAKIEAELANRAKSTFLANMSHEIRTPMNAILGYTQLLKRDQSLTKAQKDSIQVISQSGEYLLSLLNDILEISKIEAGRVTLDNHAFDLSVLLREIETLFRLQAEVRNLDFKIIQKDGVPNYLHGDSRKIRQVLINLIGNAFKFTESGSVTVTLSHTLAEGALRNISVEIRDTGIGIPQEDQERVFGTFEQIFSNSHSSLRGSGLGLAISRQYAILMGGNIQLESTVGQGSLFTFTFQAEEVDDLIPEIIKNKDIRRIIGFHSDMPVPIILVADDDLQSRKVLRLFLEQIGCNVEEAANGKEALSVVKQKRPDLIFMDIRMPVMSGLVATQRLKRSRSWRQIPVIMLSASVMGKFQQQAASVEADGFIRKPFLEEDILEALKKIPGIEFLYEKITETQPSEPGGAYDPGQVKKIPRELSDELISAARMGKVSRLHELIKDEVMPHSQELADYLLRLVRNFDYEQVIHIFKS